MLDNIADQIDRYPDEEEDYDMTELEDRLDIHKRRATKQRGICIKNNKNLSFSMRIAGHGAALVSNSLLP
jgi:hypothetical protein